MLRASIVGVLACPYAFSEDADACHETSVVVRETSVVTRETLVVVRETLVVVRETLLAVHGTAVVVPETSVVVPETSVVVRDDCIERCGDRDGSVETQVSVFDESSSLRDQTIALHDSASRRIRPAIPATGKRRALCATYNTFFLGRFI